MKNKNSEKTLLLLCWLVYTFACVGKYSYTANKVAIISYYNVSNAEAGVIGTLFFVAYGASQIIHGIFCKHYNQKVIIPLCLLISATVNVLFACELPFDLLKVLWLVNGLAEAVFWPCVILTLSKNLSQQSLDKAVVVMSTTFAFGTGIAYALSWAFVKYASYKYAFLAGGIALFAMAVAWIILYGKVTDSCNQAEQRQQTEQQKTKATWLFWIELAVLAIFAAICNFVKDGLSSWTAVILNQNFGLSQSTSIILTLALALIGVFGSYVAMLLHKKIKDFVWLSAVFYVACVVMFAIVLALFDTTFIAPIVLILGIITLCMHAVNNVITSMAPMHLRQSINAGLLSGVMNGVCYVGSAVSDYGLGAVSDSFGWKYVLYLFFAVCALPFVLSVVLSLIRFFKRKSTQTKVADTAENQ